MNIRVSNAYGTRTVENRSDAVFLAKLMQACNDLEEKIALLQCSVMQKNYKRMPTG